MRLTPRGERVVALLTFLFIIAALGFAGGIELGTINF